MVLALPDTFASRSLADAEQMFMLQLAIEKGIKSLAEELGAVWIGDTFDEPRVKLDAAIIFAPAGEIVPAALKVLDKGGTLVLGGIHMSPIPQFDYQLIYGERVVRSVANNTREDGHEFLREAAAIPVRTSVQEFALRRCE